MTKKFVSMFLALAMCLSLAATNVVAIEEVAESSHPEIDFNGPMIFYPFVYTEEPGWAWARELIGDCSALVPGYLYLQDLRTKEITQIIEEPVDMFRSDHEILYCLVNGTSIVRTNYWGEDRTVLYTAQYGNLDSLEYWEGVLLFTDGEHVIRIDLVNNSQNDMGLYEGITAIYMAEDTSFTWVDAKEVEYVRNADGYDEEVSEQAETWMEAYDGISVQPETPDSDMIAPYALMVPIAFPLSEYPVGSYFTDNKKACTDHYLENGQDNPDCPDSPNFDCNCRYYRGGSQCEGFGRYVLDRYAHLPLQSAYSSWYVKGSSDLHRHDFTVEFNDEDDVRFFFQSSSYAKCGTYLRFNDSHTAIIADISSTSVTLYDANYTSDKNRGCIVQMKEYTFHDFLYKASGAKRFGTITRIVAHSFTNALKEYNSTYHKALCAYGCGGYSYVEHTSINPGKNAVCQGCGYVGEIWIKAPVALE